MKSVTELGNEKGTLLVTCSREMLQPDPPPSGDYLYILATMRTYDVSSPLGTDGQTIPLLRTRFEQHERRHLRLLLRPAKRCA